MAKQLALTVSLLVPTRTAYPIHGALRICSQSVFPCLSSAAEIDKTDTTARRAND